MKKCLPASRWLRGFTLALLAWVGLGSAAWAQRALEPPSTVDTDCTRTVAPACLRSVQLPGAAGRLMYYASRPPGGEPATGPGAALVVVHGYSRNAEASFQAGVLATERAQRTPQTVVVAPVFQVVPGQAARCRSRGTPVVQRGEALWTCGGWAAGEASRGGDGRIGSMAALDALIAALKSQWPSLRTITLVGFSAGAQLVQRSIGWAADAPAGVRLRYVVAAPSSWLYFDPVRPQPQRAGRPVDWAACPAGSAFPGDCGIGLAVPADGAACPGYDRWKYGVRHLPANLGRSAADARAR